MFDMPVSCDDPQAAGPARHVIPERLDTMPPGPFLAAILQATDVRRLSGRDRIAYLRAQQRMASHYAAGVYDAMSSVAEYLQADDHLGWDSAEAAEAAAAEIRVALRLTRRASDEELSFALELRERLPGVWQALAAGDIDPRRARVFARATGHLPLEAARRVVDAAIDEAPGLTTGQLAARLRALAIEVDPEAASEKYRRSVTQRRVVAEPTVDGTANVLGLELPPHRVSEAMNHVNRLARSLRRDGEQRTMDQLRADVFLDLLRGVIPESSSSGSRRGGTIDMTVDLATLAGMSDTPGELAGYGPIVADIARQIADESESAAWRFTIVDPESGRPIGGGLTRRRPTAAQRRRIQQRDRRCVFPGCRMPATHSDIDHTVPYAAGGPTSEANGAPACAYDHQCRHRFDWRYERRDDGDYVWTTKLGLRYTTSGRSP